ncbi:hypothetical protein [Paracoccus sp. 22332]|uniref:hypothetical protein n=1 Tax=Paracoccus sp. 22332 TaxID=3453913 RepID=UPI003F84D921
MIAREENLLATEGPALFLVKVKNLCNNSLDEDFKEPERRARSASGMLGKSGTDLRDRLSRLREHWGKSAIFRQYEAVGRFQPICNFRLTGYAGHNFASRKSGPNPGACFIFRRQAALDIVWWAGEKRAKSLILQDGLHALPAIKTAVVSVGLLGQ